MAKKLALPVATNNKKQKPIPVRIVSEPSPDRVPYEQSAEHKRYRAQDALRTIQEATKLQADKSLMSDVKKLAKEQMNTLKKLC